MPARLLRAIRVVTKNALLFSKKGQRRSQSRLWNATVPHLRDQGRRGLRPYRHHVFAGA